MELRPSEMQAYVVSVEDLLCKLDAPAACLLLDVDGPQLPAVPIRFALLLVQPPTLCLIYETIPSHVFLRRCLERKG